MKKTTMKMLSFALLVCMLAGMASTASAGWSVLTQRRLQLENTRRELDLNLNRYRDGDWQYRLDEQGNARILRYLGSETQVAVPETLTDEEGNAHPVRSVLAGAFDEGIDAIIPDGIVLLDALLNRQEMKALYEEALEKTDQQNEADNLAGEDLEQEKRNLEHQLLELERQLKSLQESEMPDAPQRTVPKYDGIG